MKKIYIAGPMSGLKNFNFPAFNVKAAQLRAIGWDVLNPAEMDLEAGIDPNLDYTPLDYMRAARRDLYALDQADAIYFLEGWEESKGANWEWAHAKNKGLEIYYELPLPEEKE